MAKPLLSDERGQPKSMQFAHFGVLDNGAQSKASTVTSLVLNLSIAFVLIVIGAATKETIDTNRRLTELTAPVLAKKVEPIKPRIVPPKPKLAVPRIEMPAPRITVSLVKPPDLPKQPVVKMEAPKPLVIAAPPRQIIAMAAPKVVNLSHPSPPALANNSQHPTAVALGSPDHPLSAPTTTGAAKVDLGNKGVAGMPSSNTGLGRPTKVDLAGSGSPGGSNHGNGVVAVAGIPHGVPGGTGPLNSPGRVPGPVNLSLGQATPPPMPKPPAPSAGPRGSAPKVISKPKPEYTAEARQMHLEGTVTVHIRVLTTGAVEVVGITSGLGHGLDESARRAVQATRFEPATDASGHPVIWDGVVNVAFQLAG